MEIYERLQSARKRTGLSMSEIARRLGVSPQSVQQWETGTTTPRPERIRDLAALLGVTEAYLLGAPPEPEAGSESSHHSPEELAATLAELITVSTRDGLLGSSDLQLLEQLTRRLRDRPAK